MSRLLVAYPLLYWQIRPRKAELQGTKPTPAKTSLRSSIAPELKVEIKDFFKNLYNVDESGKVGLDQQEVLSKHLKEFSNYTKGTAELS